VPILIIGVARLFQFFRLKGIDRLLEGVIRNSRDLAYVANALGVCSMCVAIMTICVVGSLIVAAFLLLKKRIHFLTALSHMVILGIATIFASTMARPFEKPFLEMAIKSGDQKIESEYKSYIEQYGRGKILIGDSN
jgi:hypothetical protein